MINIVFKRIFLLATCLSIFGCASFETSNKSLLIERESTIVRSAYDAVDFLVGKNNSSQILTANGRGVLVSTLVDINDLDKSSALGRLLSEQISSRLAQHGIAVNELKLRGNLYVNKSQGELLLSREIKDISATQNADFVVTGTYAASRDSIYVTIKLVRASDSRVINAFNFNLARTSSVNGLLKD